MRQWRVARLVEFLALLQERTREIVVQRRPEVHRSIRTERALHVRL
jgi:hypothetical protein